MEIISVLMSIKPEFAFKICEGRKKCEFRRKYPRHIPLRVFIYASFPCQKIIGFGQVFSIIEEKVEVLWEKCGPLGGIEKDVFQDYFRGSQRGSALIFSEVKKFSVAIEPRKVLPNFIPPQNFYYLDEEEVQLLMEFA